MVRKTKNNIPVRTDTNNTDKISFGHRNRNIHNRTNMDKGPHKSFVLFKTKTNKINSKLLLSKDKHLTFSQTLPKQTREHRVLRSSSDARNHADVNFVVSGDVGASPRRTRSNTEGYFLNDNFKNVTKSVIRTRTATNEELQYWYDMLYIIGLYSIKSSYNNEIKDDVLSSIFCGYYILTLIAETYSNN